jgi:hypothetical protein
MTHNFNHFKNYNDIIKEGEGLVQVERMEALINSSKDLVRKPEG